MALSPEQLAESRRRAALRYHRKMQAQSPEYRAAKTAKAKAWREANPERYRALLEVLARSAGLCGICGEPVDPASFHVDHIIPLAKGGSHAYDNVQASHPLCNIRKGASL